MENEVNYNEIDMETDFVPDDDDTSFGNIQTFKGKEIVIDNSEDDSRDYNRNTGVMITLNDSSEDSPYPTKMLKVTSPQDLQKLDLSNVKTPSKPFKEVTAEEQLEAYSNGDALSMFDEDYLSCSVDEEEGSFFDTPQFIEEEEEFESELDLEEAKASKRPYISKAEIEGKIEKDYWEKIKKQHQKTNTKGAQNFGAQQKTRYVGNPEEEIKMFNAGFKTDSATDGGVTADGGSSVGITGTASAGDGGCCGESLKKHFGKDLFENLLLVTGFDVTPTKDGKYILTDLCNMVPEQTCKNKDEIITTLDPYISDTFITPLKYQTGEKFNDCKEWVDWYAKEENQKKFPGCKSDIEYCDYIANKRYND